MEEEQTNLASPTPLQSGALPTAVTKRAAKPKKSKPGRKPFRLTKFDKFLLEVVRRGESDSESLRARYNLDPLQFESRLRELASRGYVIPDAANPRILRFGLEGFNRFPPKAAKAERREAETAKPPAPAETLNAKPAETRPATESDLPQRNPVPAPLQTPVNEPDLMDLLSKGRPDPSYTKTFVTISAVGRKWLEEQGKRKPVEETLIVEVPSQKANRESTPPSSTLAPHSTEAKAPGNGERCELCRSAFTLAVGKEANPKYGHCFCGAPYHKDCYDSLLEGSGTQCVRCGKRLSLILDKVSEEAIKELKKLFD